VTGGYLKIERGNAETGGDTFVFVRGKLRKKTHFERGAHEGAQAKS